MLLEDEHIDPNGTTVSFLDQTLIDHDIAFVKLAAQRFAKLLIVLENTILLENILAGRFVTCFDGGASANVAVPVTDDGTATGNPLSDVVGTTQTIIDFISDKITDLFVNPLAPYAILIPTSTPNDVPGVDFYLDFFEND